jgi:RNA polymerase sigma factor (sigma-70 family)
VSGEKQAFVTSMATRYGKRLKQFLSARLRNADDVPDLAQEVYLRLLRVNDHEAIRSPEAYLVTVARHVLHQHLLGQDEAPTTVEISDIDEEFQSTPAVGPDARAEFTQRLDVLEGALRQLPPREYAAFMMHRFAGYTIEEIAEKLGVARVTAKKYLAKALAHCRAHDRRERKDDHE